MKSRKLVHGLLVVLLTFCSLARAADNLLITEFMARNDGALRDEDGDASDWIEIHNAGTNTVNLEGWFLTDSEFDLTQWRFPATNLAPNAYLIVFASEKDRSVAGATLHTNFKLNDNGEYLALIAPDEITVVSAYELFAPQVSGVTYGIPVTQSNTTLLAAGAFARVFVPKNNTLLSSWTTTAFDDSAWLSVPTGLGFDADGETPFVAMTLANSQAEFSGVQGQNNWFYGYWDSKADASGGYSDADFTPFPNNGGGFGPDNYFNAGTGAWDWFNGNPPYTELTSDGGRPAHSAGNASLPDHWVIRRYINENSGPVTLAGSITHTSDWVYVTASGVAGTGLLYVYLLGAGDGYIDDIKLVSGLTPEVGVNLINNGDFETPNLNAWTIAPILANSSLSTSVKHSGNRSLHLVSTGTGASQGTSINQTFGVMASQIYTLSYWFLPLTNAPSAVVRTSGSWLNTSPAPCGDRTIARIFVDGVEVYQQQAAASGVNYSFTVSAHLGSKIDFALDPGLSGLDACVNTIFTSVVTSADPNSAVVADSAADWSMTGTQGEKNWFYGYYNRSTDPDRTYQANNFIAYPHGGGPQGTNNFWDEQEWDWPSGDPPFDKIGQYWMIPNGTNSGGAHWVIRRWLSEVAGTITVDWAAFKELPDQNNPGGGGVTLRVFHNGVQRDVMTVAGGDTVGIRRTIVINNVMVGDAIDIAVDPTNVDGREHDDTDKTFVTAVIRGSPSLNHLLVSELSSIMRGSNATAYIRLPFTVEDPSIFNALTLRMKFDDGFVAYLNGVEVARMNAPIDLTWNSSAAMERSDSDNNDWREWNLTDSLGLLRTGENVLAIHGLNSSVNDGDFLVLPELNAASVMNDPVSVRYFMLPTPGTANGSGNSTLGPLVLGASHLPNVPKNNENLSVTAQVAPTFWPVSTVRLVYRVMFSNEVNVAMFDDGQHGDGAAGDGTWGGVIPASASNPGQMVRYYIFTTDNEGNTTRFPSFLEPKNSPQYQGTVVSDPSLTNNLPVLHYFVQDVVAGTNFAGTRASIFWDNEFFDNVEVSAHGQTTWYEFPKRSMNFNLNTGYKLRWKPGQERVKAFDLLTTSPDKAYLRLVLAFETFRNAGVPTHYAFPVRMQQNGVFNSVMSFVEQGNEDLLERNGLNRDGAFYKIYLPLSDAYTGAKKVTRKNEPNDDLQAMINGLSQSGNALRQYLFDNVDIPEAVNFLAAIQVAQNEDCCSKNFYLYRDTGGTGEWQIMPWDLDLTFGRVFTAWCGDNNCTGEPYIWGGYYNTNLYPFNLYYTQARVSRNYMGAETHIGNAILSFPDTSAMFYRRWSTVQEELLQKVGTHPLLLKFERRVDELADQIRQDAALDFVKWAPFNPRNFLTNQTLSEAVTLLKTGYFAPRRPWAFSTLAFNNGGPYVGSQPSNAIIHFAAVEFNPSSGRQDQEYIQLRNTNNYSVDVSGWKVSGGVEFTFRPGTVVASNGSVYLSPNVNAFRARSSGPRGGQGLLVQGNYKNQLSARGESLQLSDNNGRVVATTNFPGTPSLPQRYLRITEVMFHPAPPPPGMATNADEFEYIELKNIGPVPISLLGVRFTRGIEFNFTGSAVTNLAPSQIVVVVRNLAAYTSRYGGAALVAGQYVGLLDNSGETIRLEDAAGEKILEFTYDNKWYPIADGPGFSLAILDQAADFSAWNSKTNWRPSAVTSGSPGSTPPPGPAIPPILVNEVLTHTDPPAVDTIELYNPTALPVDIGGWFLSDDFGTPKKFQIPFPTIIQAHGYVVFTEADFNPTNPPSPLSFAFSSLGDEAYLFSGNEEDELSGYYHGFAFGAGENGVSFGRYVDSLGAEHFVAQSDQSFYAANEAPKVGPIVISEIHYHPTDYDNGTDNGDDEFIELQNATLNPAGPFPGQPGPTNGWRLRGTVEFNFPLNFASLPGSFLLVANFDPADAGRLAAFRSRFDVPEGVPILGPYSGQLDNSSGSIRLSKPDQPESGAMPYILVDEVDYADAAPWPGSADGKGPSLQRLNAAQYGNDPINWTAATPSAGRTTSVGTAPTISVQPANVNAVGSLMATLTVGANGSPSLNYQWRFNGANIPGATGSSFTLTNVQPTQAGLYSVTVFNSAGSVDSSNATVTVALGPFFTQHPQSATRSVGGSITFTAAAQGSSAISFQWRLNGTNAPGTVSSTPTNSTLTVANLQPAQGGVYTVIATDNIGSLPSLPATLTLQYEPTIIQHPISQSVVTGGDVILSVSVTNAATLPLGFRWRRNGTSLPGGFFIQNEHTGFFIVTNVQTSAGYNVIVTNIARPSGVGSSTATVTPLADTDGDLMDDDWETLFRFDPMNPNDRELDADDDGMKNWEEYIAGTNPRDELSYLKVNALTLGAGATLTFGAVSNRTYTIQFTDSIGSGPWSKLTDVGARTVNREEIVADPRYTTNRFYRVAVPQQP